MSVGKRGNRKEEKGAIAPREPMSVGSGATGRKKESPSPRAGRCLSEAGQQEGRKGHHRPTRADVCREAGQQEGRKGRHRPTRADVCREAGQQEGRKGRHRPTRADVCREAGNEEDYGYEVAKAGLL